MVSPTFRQSADVGRIAHSGDVTATATFLGSQAPTYLWVPAGVSSAGHEAVAVARRSGMVADKWQETVLDGACQERIAGPGEIAPAGSYVWAANEVVLIVGRQNGKGGVIECRELAGIFVWDEPYIMHSAHEFKTAGQAFGRMEELIQADPDLDRRVQSVSRSKGMEGFKFQWKHEDYGDGKDPRCTRCQARNRKTHVATLSYLSRTGGAGRGYAGVSTVILDEAMILDDSAISAMVPTLATQPNWQVWYCGSAGSKTMRSGSTVLARQRRRGLAKDPAVMMAEFQAHLRHQKGVCIPDVNGAYDHPLDDRLDPKTWAKTNPAYGRRISHGFMKTMANGGMDARDFDREFLGDGDYPEPEGWNLVSEELWRSLMDIDARGAGAPTRFAVGVETTWDGDWTAITIAAPREDLRWHFEMIECRAGTHWAPDYLKALVRRRPVAIVIDKQSPANVIISEVETDRRVKKVLVHPTLQQFGAWSKKTATLMIEPGADRLVHLGQPTLDAAVKVVQQRDLGQGMFVWDRITSSGNAAPFIAGTMAIGGFLLKGKKGSGRPLVAS